MSFSNHAKGYAGVFSALRAASEPVFLPVEKFSPWPWKYPLEGSVVPGCREQRWSSAAGFEIQNFNPKEITMKFRSLAIATVFASLMGTAALHAEHMTTDRDHLNGYSTMTYRNIYLDGGEKAAVAVSGAGSSTIRLSVYDYNNNLITNTTCRYNTCVLSWVANWNANFYVTVENLSAYGTDYGFALDRE